MTPGARLAATSTAEEAAVVAREAEASGAALVALRAWQVVLQRDPDATEAWTALATLYEEAGDVARAEACRRRGAPEEARTPAPPSPDPEASDADLVRFLDRFAGREDIHARMWRRGEDIGWSPVPAPLTVELLRAHLAGRETLGVYPIALDARVRWLCLDLDVARAALEGVRGDAQGTASLRQRMAVHGVAMLGELATRGVTGLLEDSGYKGRHVWVFLDPPAPVAGAHALATGLARALQPSDQDFRVEAFPRQAAVREQGVGSLVKLPLGVHLRTGRRAALLDARGEVDTSPFATLRAAPRYSIEQLEERLGEVVRAGEGRPPTPPEGPTPAPPRSRPWTEGDFEASPTVGPVYAGCAVLREIVRRALAEREMDHGASVVVNHALGHLPDGPRAANYLYDHVPGVAAEARMGAPHRGSPISCARVRRRVPEVVDKVGCECTFRLPPGGYPHPLRHLEDPALRRPVPVATEDALEALARALEHGRRLDGEVAALRGQVVDLLRRSPDGRWRHGGGEWVLTEEDGLPAVTWVPDGAS